jgi:hypothetical protein
MHRHDITERLDSITGGLAKPVTLVTNDRPAAIAVFRQARVDANGNINPYGYHLKTVPAAR